MGDTFGTTLQFLRPILDTYRSSALAVVGCHAEGIERPSCELDVVLVTNEKRPNSTVRIGEFFLDIFFVSEREVLKPTNPDHAVSLSHAKTVRDTSLILSTSLAANLAILHSSAQKSSAQRLTSALKSLSRAEVSISESLQVDADYWLLSAAYDYAYSLLYSREVSPSPSHLLGQLRAQAAGAPKSFESFSSGAGLRSSSRSNCDSRLEGLGVLYDVLGDAHQVPKGVRSTWTTTQFACVSAKAKELSDQKEHAESYSYLGIEIVKALKQLIAQEGRSSGSRVGPSYLTTGNNRLIGDRLLRDIGLSREGDSLTESLEVIRTQVSKLARMT